jgi:hypothetical protein
MSWKKLKLYSNFLLVFSLFLLHSNPTLGQELDTIFIDLTNLSEQDTTLNIHYNIPKSKCKRGTLPIPIQLENHDTSMIFMVYRFKGNGYVKRKNSAPIIIDPKSNIFQESWVLNELLLSDNCSENRRIQSLSIEYYNAFYDSEKESKTHLKSLQITYHYVD